MNQKQERGSLSNLETKLETIRSMGPLSTSCCIYRVPPSLRKVNEGDYTPNLVSIGPFHRENKNLEPKQQLKLWYLREFLKRTQGSKSLDDYAKFVQDSEDKIRSCYSENIQMESDEFISMILTDAGFIIELFLASSDDLLVSKPWPMADIMQDLVLIENQLPLFILEGLFSQTFPTGFYGKFSFLDLAYPILVRCFAANIYYSPNAEIFDMPSTELRVQHLCDILRTFCLPTNPLQRDKLRASKRSYSVSQLYESGVKLQVHGTKKKLPEVEFSEGILRIPGIRVSNWIEKLLRNVVAFEQCHYPSKHYVTDYVVLLDFLIQSRKDVEILVEEKIMESFLDGDAVASMFTSLRKNVMETSANSGYVSLHRDLDAFYKETSHKYKAIFVREYWNTPWKKASSIAAVLLLFLTLIQTICSLIPLFKK